VNGSAELTGGLGSGVLLVDGDLLISGPVQYDGLIVVTGRVGSTPWGLGEARIRGALVSGNPHGSDQALAGNVQVSYSNCLVNNALRLVARPQPLRSRAWIELF
jgi:hypothetical protein